MAKIKKRRVVSVDTELRARVETATARIHAIVSNREVPRAHFDGRCLECSLREECGPEIDVPTGALMARIRTALD
jgi:CRISPR/Cas system-associated exonuclease Cas4 (RecB family)